MNPRSNLHGSTPRVCCDLRGLRGLNRRTQEGLGALRELNPRTVFDFSYESVCAPIPHTPYRNPRTHKSPLENPPWRAMCARRPDGRARNRARTPVPAFPSMPTAVSLGFKKRARCRLLKLASTIVDTGIPAALPWYGGSCAQQFRYGHRRFQTGFTPQFDPTMSPAIPLPPWNGDPRGCRRLMPSGRK